MFSLFQFNCFRHITYSLALTTSVAVVCFIYGGNCYYYCFIKIYASEISFVLDVTQKAKSFAICQMTIAWDWREKDKNSERDSVLWPINALTVKF